MSRLVIFDFDGTLSDSRTSIVETFRQATISRGHSAPDPDDVAARIGLPLVQMFEEIVPSDASENAALVEAYRAAYVAIDEQHTSLFPGVEELLDSLAGRHLAIATSKSQSGADASVGRAGLTHHFDQIVGHDRVPRPKPFPDMLALICDNAGIPPDQAVMVGDTTFDLEMADQMSMRAIGVSWGMHGPARLARWPVVHSVTELRESIGPAA